MGLKGVLSVCFLLACTVGKSQSEAIAKRAGGLSAQSLTQSIHSFAEKLHRVSADGHSANTAVSPLSVYTTLLMTSVAARGPTLEQIERTLNISINNDTTWHDRMTKLQKDVRASTSDDVITEMANMMWVSKGMKVKSDYFRVIANVFQTHIREADFNQPEPVRNVVNQRISNATRGHIDQLLPPGSISKETKMLLANALYFKGLWLHPFNVSKTFNEPFFPENNRSIAVPMMHQNDMFRAGNFKDLDAKGIFLPYRDERHGLLIILPNRKSDLKGTENRLFASGYTPTKLLRRMIQRDVNLTLPKFKIRFDAEMTGTLKQMGIVDLFSDNADLSGLSSTALTSGLKVSKVYHQATIEVNEGGSEAAAVTAFEITPLMGGAWDDFGPIEFKADHPFLFYIIDRENDHIPLFVGRLNNPPGDSVQAKTTAQPLKPAIEPEAQAETQEQLSASSHRAWLYRSSPIVFPDSDRFRRSDNPENVTVDSKPLNETEEVDTRVKDTNWFKKPTAPQVLIPISGESDKSPSRPSRPDKTMTAPSPVPTTTVRPSDATISFSIFGNVPANPPGHAPLPSPSQSWNPSNIGPPSVGPSNQPHPLDFLPNYPPPPPATSPFSIGWFQGQGNENFPQSAQGTGIRFPDFQFSPSPGEQHRKNFPIF